MGRGWGGAGRSKEKGEESEEGEAETVAVSGAPFGGTFTLEATQGVDRVAS